MYDLAKIVRIRTIFHVPLKIRTICHNLTIYLLCHTTFLLSFSLKCIILVYKHHDQNWILSEVSKYQSCLVGLQVAFAYLCVWAMQSCLCITFPVSLQLEEAISDILLLLLRNILNNPIIIPRRCMLIHIFPFIEAQVKKMYIMVMSRTFPFPRASMTLFVCVYLWVTRHYIILKVTSIKCYTSSHTYRRRIAHTANSPQYTIRSAVNSSTAQKVVDILGQLIASLRLIDLTAGAMENACREIGDKFSVTNPPVLWGNVSLHEWFLKKTFWKRTAHFQKAPSAVFKSRKIGKWSL